MSETLRKRIFLGFIAIDVLLLVVVVFCAINYFRKTSTVVVKYAPLDATLKIDGSVYAAGSYKITPGAHKIELSRDGFDTKTYTVTIRDDSIFKLYNYLTSSDSDDPFEKYYSIQAATPLYDIADDAADAFLSRHSDQYNLVEKYLPIRHVSGDDSLVYWVLNRSERSCQKLACVNVILGSNTRYDDVLSALESLGFDLKMLDIKEVKNEY